MRILKKKGDCMHRSLCSIQQASRENISIGYQQWKIRFSDMRVGATFRDDLDLFLGLPERHLCRSHRNTFHPLAESFVCVLKSLPHGIGFAFCHECY